jgi:hypothetical protein
MAETQRLRDIEMTARFRVFLHRSQNLIAAAASFLGSIVPDTARARVIEDCPDARRRRRRGTNPHS